MELTIENELFPCRVLGEQMFISEDNQQEFGPTDGCVQALNSIQINLHKMQNPLTKSQRRKPMSNCRTVEMMITSRSEPFKFKCGI